MTSFSIDFIVMWVGSAWTILMWSQIAALAGWMLIHFQHIASYREKRDTFFTFCIAVLFIVLQYLWSIRGLVACQGVWMEAASDVFAYGAGRYILASLNRRHLFYLFAQQQYDRRKVEMPFDGPDRRGLTDA